MSREPKLKASDCCNFNYQIWRFPLELTDSQNVLMPSDSKILSVKEQHGQLFLWAMVDGTGRPIRRRITIVGTGTPLPGSDMGKFIDSVVMDNFVWHVFAR